MFEELIQLTYLPITHQLADILTKIIHSPQLKYLSSKLRLFDTTQQPPPNLRGDIGTSSSTAPRQHISRVNTTTQLEQLYYLCNFISRH